MDDRGANIDIVFRNGLRDFEVLPPQDVWENIQPAVRKNQRPLAFLRAAAMFAVLISLSFLAYRFSRQMPAGTDMPVLAMNPESFAPQTGNLTVSRPVFDTQETGTGISTDIQETTVLTVTTGNLNPSVSGLADYSESSDIRRRENNDASYLQVELPVADYMKIEGESSLIPDNTSRKIPGRWAVSAMVSPTYQARISTGDNQTVAQAMNSEQTVMTYTGGLALSYKVNRRLSIQSGLYYSTVGKELQGIAAYSGFRDVSSSKGGSSFLVTTSAGDIATSNSDIFLTDGLAAGRIRTNYDDNVIDPVKSSLYFLDNSIQQSFSYLELPFVLRYKVIDKALDLNLIGGVSSNLLVDNSVFASTETGRTEVGTTTGLNSITFSSSIGMGMEYNISNSFSLNLEPTFRYYLNPFNNIPGMRIHPYSFGVFSGITYKF